MRPLLALAILLLGISSAAPETKFQESIPQESIPAVSAKLLPASFTLEVSEAKADRDLNVDKPAIESSDSAHDQDEEAASPPKPPAPVGADAQADADVVGSLDGVCKALMTSAIDYDLPVPFFANLIWQESGLRHDVVSKAGAQGIAQFMPEVAAEQGLGNPFDPRQAIPASARLLHALREHFGNLGFAAAAYNAGAHRVGEWLDKRKSLPRETRTYVLRVTGRSIEAWRKSPVDDSRLTFVKALPCRDLPEFAALEADQRDMSASDQEPPPPPDPDDDARKVASRTHKSGAVIHLAGRTVTVRLAHKIARVERVKHEAIHRARAPHEKRRVARGGGPTSDALS
jgi:Transglycosylase SLT domain